MTKSLIPAIILAIFTTTCSTAMPEKDSYDDLSELIRITAKTETIKTIGEILSTVTEKMNANEISFAEAFVKSYNEYVQKYKASIGKTE